MSRKNMGREHKVSGKSAGRPQIIEQLTVNPSISAKLQTLNHILCLVISPRFFVLWAAVQYRWPQQCLSHFGADSDLQIREIGRTSFFYVTQIQKESQDSWSTSSISLVINIVVMLCIWHVFTIGELCLKICKVHHCGAHTTHRSIKLAILILQQL